MRVALPSFRSPASISLPSIATGSARIGFGLMFPGYFVYHYAISRGWIPAFAGGLFGISSLALAAVFVALAPWIVGTQVRRGVLLALSIGLLLFLVAIWSSANLLIDPGYLPAVDGWNESVSTICAWMAALLVGRFCPLSNDAVRRRLRQWMGLISLAVIHAILSSGSLLGGYLGFSEFNGDVIQSSYQGIGRSITVTSIFAMATFRGDGARLGVLAVGVLLLASIGSRSEFAALLALFLMVSLVAVVNQRRLTLLAGLSLVGAALTLFLAPLIIESRIGELLDLATSSSWQARQELTSIAVARIADSPLLGDFVYYQRDLGTGGYSHNILSAWTNYTFLGIALYAGISAACLMVAGKRIARWRQSSASWVAAFSLNFVGVILIVSAIPVSHALPALGWGVTLQALASEEWEGE